VRLQPGPRCVHGGEALDDHPVELRRRGGVDHAVVDEAGEPGDGGSHALLPGGELRVLARQDARLRDERDGAGGLAGISRRSYPFDLGALSPVAFAPSHPPTTGLPRRLRSERDPVVVSLGAQKSVAATGSYRPPALSMVLRSSMKTSPPLPGSSEPISV